MKETINKIFSLFLAGQKIKAMEFALNSNLFDFLKDKSANLGDITQFLKSDAENTKIFLNALCSLGLLERKNDFYKNSAFSERYFVKSSKFYCGELFYLRKRMGESGAKCLNLLSCEEIRPYAATICTRLKAPGRLTLKEL
ncbi:methyltransferase dimerization domain-containing protein [Campylobacter rectus]|uniref:methyltransferase family protein n=1 Tax=Campylobacter rectus TaxID=203 RepID=UPI0028E8C741|nr:methyltransferase dimerization domain-containing protein [Campylobacter rectus]